MPRGIKKVEEEILDEIVEETTEEIEVVTPETPVEDKGLYKLLTRCKCGKLLGEGRDYNTCPKCGNVR
jgi:hypothetical protein